jgi:DNA repair protein SbcD/Mre11
MMIRLLHTADLHLSASFPSLGERGAERQRDFLATLDHLVMLAIKHDVHLFLIAGDLFDRPEPEPSAVARVQSAVKRLRDRGIVPVILPGTHDHTVGPHSIYRKEQFPGAILLDQPTVEEPVSLSVKGEPVFLYGFAFRTFASKDALAGMARREGEGIHIGLLHGSRQGSPEWEYRKKDLPFTLSQLKGWNLDYVALGHYHTFETLEDDGRLWACYPGSPEGKRFGENGARYAALVNVEPGGARVERVQVNSRTLQESALDLSGCEDALMAAEAIAALSDSNLLLRLTLTGIVESPLDLRALRERCRDGFFHLEFEDRTRLFDSDFARRIENEETVRGLFVRRARSLMEEKAPEQRDIVEEAFREVLVRFNAFGGGAR